MDYGLDLIMNPHKVKKKFNLENYNNERFIDIIKETIKNELEIKDKLDDKILEKIIELSIEIYKQNSKIPIFKNINKQEIKLDFIPEPVKNISLSNVKIKEKNIEEIEIKKYRKIKIKQIEINIVIIYI